MCRIRKGMWLKKGLMLSLLIGMFICMSGSNWADDEEETLDFEDYQIACIYNMISQMYWDKKANYYRTEYEQVYGQLTQSEQETFQRYLPVLRNEKEIYFFLYYYKEYVNDDGTYYGRTYPYTKKMMLDEWIAENLEGVTCTAIKQISFIDINEDGKLELVLVTNIYENIILYQDGEDFYATYMSGKEFQRELQNGIHVSTGGGIDIYQKLTFEDGQFVRQKLAEQHVETFFIRDEVVTQAEFDAWLEGIKNTAPDAVHYDVWGEETYDYKGEEGIFAQLEGMALNTEAWVSNGSDAESEAIADETYYAVYDFGQDGYLELVSTAKLGNGQYSENHFYHVRNGEVIELPQQLYGEKGDEFDLLGETLYSSFDESTGSISYIAQNTNLDGSSWQQICNGYFYIEDGVVMHIPVLGYECERTQEGQQTRFYQMISHGEEAVEKTLYRKEDISEEAYDVQADGLLEERAQREIKLSFHKIDADTMSKEEVFLTLLLSYQESEY